MPGTRNRRVVMFVDALEERKLMSHAPLHAPQPAALIQSHRQPPRASSRWSFLADSYWYVPTPNTPAMLFGASNQTIAPVLDQTVFHITGYRSGYFWGVSVTQLGSSTPTTSSMIGSVTPEGRVLLNFTRTDGSTDPTVTQGIGVMTRKHGQWTMENQMFTPPGSPFQVGHWAYMVQTRPGRPGWNSLPVAGVSVPEFLGNSQGTGPQPIGT